MHVKLADHALFKMVRYVLLRPLRPELDGTNDYMIRSLILLVEKKETNIPQNIKIINYKK
jgi:hypothetical protein